MTMPMLPGYPQFGGPRKPKKDRTFQWAMQAAAMPAVGIELPPDDEDEDEGGGVPVGMEGEGMMMEENGIPLTGEEPPMGPEMGGGMDPMMGMPPDMMGAGVQPPQGGGLGGMLDMGLNPTRRMAGMAQDAGSAYFDQLKGAAGTIGRGAGMMAETAGDVARTARGLGRVGVETMFADPNVPVADAFSQSLVRNFPPSADQLSPISEDDGIEIGDIPTDMAPDQFGGYFLRGVENATDVPVEEPDALPDADAGVQLPAQAPTGGTMGPPALGSDPRLAGMRNVGSITLDSKGPVQPSFGVEIDDYYGYPLGYETVTEPYGAETTNIYEPENMDEFRPDVSASDWAIDEAQGAYLGGRDQDLGRALALGQLANQQEQVQGGIDVELAKLGAAGGMGDTGLTQREIEMARRLIERTNMTYGFEMPFEDALAFIGRYSSGEPREMDDAIRAYAETRRPMGVADAQRELNALKTAMDMDMDMRMDPNVMARVRELTKIVMNSTANRQAQAGGGDPDAMLLDAIRSLGPGGGL